MSLRSDTPLGEIGELIIDIGGAVVLFGISVCLVDAIINGNNSKIVKFGTKLLASSALS